MEVRQLAVLRELGERESVAAVARALHVSSSAVSQQLRAVQRRAGVPLTEKRGRVLGLTPAGVALALAATGVSTAMARTDEAVARFQNDPGLPVTVSVSLSINDIRNESWVTGHAGFPLAEAVNVVAAAADAPLRIAHRINEFFVAASVVATGAALALLPRYTIAPRKGDGMVLVPFRDLSVGRQIDVLSRPEVLVRTSVRRVLAELVIGAGQR
ncbi:MAG: LysR family transcriptional regulator [Cryobacterium sp.]|uniref:LysR family transcriptional regulator n=1 Tax=unclassified Cryobacterium TaxID=2649013 RepID=UPI0018CAAA81|nr:MULTISPECIES: LysR family transcriptional regulator [unclassified Cryobacterium]MCY7403557.1 LysR family transcriptional regulator [Cryobacterium sp.]MEC5153250.1 DNA-binding transcriptional LysR family regulator [Cryobacterium sp. CAN_C3]